MPATSRVDSSDLTHLPLCSCGWRGPVCFSKVEALTIAVVHEQIAHPESESARVCLRRTMHHNGATGPRTTSGRFAKQNP